MLFQPVGRGATVENGVLGDGGVAALVIGGGHVQDGTRLAHVIVVVL